MGSDGVPDTPSGSLQFECIAALTCWDRSQSGCGPGWDVLNCSCTQASGYWSDSTNAGELHQVRFVNFVSGATASTSKNANAYARAVRGGFWIATRSRADEFSLGVV